jgi:putative protease
VSSLNLLELSEVLPELLAPAGNWDCAKAAVENGADAIYFGLDQFNARMRADNFTIADLPDLMAFLHGRGVRGYVTFNTLMFPEELGTVEACLRSLMAAGVDAAIVQDVGVCRLIRHLSPDFPIHASTQMTITSEAGVAFARHLGCDLVVLARECSLTEIAAIQTEVMPLEVFVHGALCVAYSGQCLTSEALGGRSANRGECAQACRMTYELIADGQTIALGDRHYLLSPQDLSGLTVLPDLVKTGVRSLKIEGRLKTPEYVANVTRIYRDALDALERGSASVPRLGDSAASGEDPQYQLEMAFSRGLYTGWFQGINNQALVHGRFAKKRGVYLGEVTAIDSSRLHLKRAKPYPLQAGDGVVFERGERSQDKEVGGRIYKVETSRTGDWLTFSREHFSLRSIQVGDRVWKTNDPSLDRQIRQTYTSDHPQFRRPLWFSVTGGLGKPLGLTIEDRTGHAVSLNSTLALTAAHTQPLTHDRLREQLGRLGNTPFYLEELHCELEGNLMLPVRELNDLRRRAIEQLQGMRGQPRSWTINPSASFRDLLGQAPLAENGRTTDSNPFSRSDSAIVPGIIPLVRNLAQLQAVLDLSAEQPIDRLYCELEDPRRYSDAVAIVRDAQASIPGRSIELFVAAPRITKPGEQWILQQVRRCNADGYLIRNYDHLVFFQNDRCVADFSYNIANPLTAAYFKQTFPQLERLTASYDLNGTQLESLATIVPPLWLEVTIHQYMPLFHMEHCVFCAFLSEGTDYTNCGRPCDQYQVKLRDRVGVEHILQADAGCRNTVFNGTAQTGAEWVQRFQEKGLRYFRVEFLQETPDQVKTILRQYDRLLRGEMTGTDLWKQLRQTGFATPIQKQLGVTRGTF